MKANLLLGLAYYPIAALLDGDPLALIDTWTDVFLTQCESLPFLEVTDYPWDPEVEGCRDNPLVASCYMARRLSSLQTCSDALENWNMCSLFPDALTNYCCESVTAQPSLCPNGLIVGGQGGDGRVNVQAARPYLPQPDRRRLSPATIVDGSFNKSAIFIFPDRFSLCTAAQSAWRIFRLAAMFFDMDSLAGMSMPPPDIFSSGELWPLLNAAVEGHDVVHKRQLRDNSTDTDKKTPHSERHGSTGQPLTIPSPSLGNADSQTRFIDQWGPSEPFPIPQRRLRSNRRLMECGGMSQLIADFSAVATDYFGGAIEAPVFSERLAQLINDNFLVVNATEAKLPYKQARAASRYTGLVTPAFVMVPACQPTAVELLSSSSQDVESVAASVPTLIRLINAQASEFSTAIAACENCMEELWAMIVMRANDQIGDPREHLAAMAEGGRIRSGLNEFHQSISRYIQATPDAQLPQTIGDALQLALGFAQKAAGSVAANSASIMEAGLLVIDVMQRELSEGGELGDIQKAIATFIKEDLGCANKKGFQLDGDPDYPVDEESSGFWFRRRRLSSETPVRELARMRQQQQVRGVQVVESSPPSTSTESPPPIAGSGNLLTPFAPLSGYKCADNLPGLFEDYLSQWLSRSECKDIIQAVGCSAPPSTQKILPRTVLLNACPKTWIEMCRDKVTVNDLGRALRDSMDEDDDGITLIDGSLDWEDDVSSSETLAQLFSQLSDPRPYEPLRQCLDPSYRRAQQQSVEVFSMAAEDTSSSSTTTTTSVSTTTSSGVVATSARWPSLVAMLAFMMSH